MTRIPSTDISRPWMMSLILLGTLATWLTPDAGHARKELLAQEEKDQQAKAGRIYLETLALTSHGPIDTAPLVTAAAARLAQLGYRASADPAQPHDVTVKIKCEELKTWEGTGRSGGDADMVNAAVRLWKGPACQISYRFGVRWADWRHEVRTEFANPQEAARQAGQQDSGAYAIAKLIERVQADSFPFLLAAEWGQSTRLISGLGAADASAQQKQLVIGLLGTMLAADAIPQLTTALKDPDQALAQAAAAALGTIGHEDGIPALLTLFKTGTAEQHRAAASGLGRLAPLHPNSEIVPTLLAALPAEPVPTQTLIVRALGKTTDRRILEPLRALHRAVLKQARSDSAPELKDLLTTLGIALDGFDGTHTEE